MRTTRRGLAALPAFRPALEDYLKRCFIGHYSPAGNHFFAYAIRGPVVEMLDPKPLPYQPEGHAVDFGGYLAAPPP